MWNFRSKTSFQTREGTIIKRIKRTLFKSSPIGCMFPTMGLPNVPLAKTFPRRSVRVFRKQKCVQGKLAKNRRLRIKNLGTILNTPAFHNAEIFSRESFRNRNLHRRLWGISLRKGNDKLGLCHRYRGNSRDKRESSRISLTGSKRKNPPWLKGLKSPRRLISFFELLSTYIGLRLWAPNRQENNDL